MANIIVELLTIADKRWGADIRMEIYSALDKLNKELEAKKGGKKDGRH